VFLDCLAVATKVYSDSVYSVEVAERCILRKFGLSQAAQEWSEHWLILSD